MKLQGLRVIDLSVYLPGPYLTLALADHGADVIKVERPDGGDPTRGLGPADGEETVYFRTLNRGKKSVVLDLKQAEDRERLLSLCETADVFVETFRPGVVERLGVDYETVRARNPRIVYCSVSAFGQQGPYRGRPAHDLGVEAISGALGLSLGAQGAPVVPGIPVADMLAALQGLSGILMALLRREQTGRGDFLDIGMQDAMLAALPNMVGPVFAEGRDPEPGAERTTGGSAFYRFYETRDGRHIALAGEERKFVDALLDDLGRPDLADLVEGGIGANQAPLHEFLEQTFRQRTLAEWVDHLSRLDVCFAPVNTLSEALRDPNALARGMVIKADDGRVHLASPIRFQDEPAEPDWRAPALGDHQAVIFAAKPKRNTPP
jgi:crotonobetainyl-CoA:carnitine CoA-transferase CaiB-like acyl-CoA transferase